MRKPHVGIIKGRFFGPWGIQTRCLESRAGLNRVGIIPDMLWDEPTDWGAFSDPTPELGLSQGRLPISSARLRSLPAWLMYRLRPLSVRFARLGLERHDFVYGVESGARMAPAVPNLCFTTGPSPSRLRQPDPAFWTAHFDQCNAIA
jgi:hypothetical protein